MRIDTFTAVTMTAIVGISLVLLSANANAGSNERYMHHCSITKKQPTVIDVTGTLTWVNVEIEMRKYFPGINPKTKVFTLSNGKQYFDARGLFKGELKRCYFRNKNWTAKKRPSER